MNKSDIKFETHRLCFNAGHYKEDAVYAANMFSLRYETDTRVLHEVAYRKMLSLMMAIDVDFVSLQGVIAHNVMNISTITLCPVCGSERIHKYVSVIDHYVSGEMFDLYECAVCGMRFTQGAPAEKEAARYYSSPNYISHTNTRKGLLNRAYHAARAVTLRRKARLVMRVSGNRGGGRLLDIGAGTGHFAREMSRRNFAVEAVEADAAARAAAAKITGVKEKGTDAFTLYENESFDAITMWHVLEHVYRLAEEWQTLRRLLKKDGRLVIAVPNCASLDARRYGEFWAAYDVPRHLWHFTPHTMRLMAERYGFRITSSHPMPLDAFYISMLSGKYARHRLAFIRGAAFGAYSWFRTFGDKERSSSIVYIMEKL